MKIQPVSLVNYSNYTSSKLTSIEKPVTYKSQSDSVHFTAYNYGKALKDMTTARLERETTVGSYFKILMSNIFSDDMVEKTPELVLLNNTYKNKGLKGMLLELCKAHPSDEFKGIIGRLDENPVLTVGSLKIKGLLNVMDDNFACTVSEPVIKLINYGRQGFWNSVLDKSDAMRDIRLSFINRDKSTWNNLSDKIIFEDNKISEKFSIELSLDKKADLTAHQQNNVSSMVSVFRSFNGHKKMTAFTYGESKPEYTYYNKDGTKAFWKNFFFGGSVVEPIY